jgi:hypothetical protein
MNGKNVFIENLKLSYQNALTLIDEEVFVLIQSGNDFKGVVRFVELTNEVLSVFDIAKSLYTIIYQQKHVLKHFETKKHLNSCMPLSFVIEEIDGEYIDLYKKMMRDNWNYFYTENVFDKDRFNQFFIMSLLDENGYSKSHWYFSKQYINEIEYMLDYLSHFIEVDYSPIAEKNDKDECQDNDRYISKEVKVAVWRRDLGKCVECGSKEKIEYDHIIPFSKGGSNTERNIQLLCEKCNRRKLDNVQ